MRLIDAEDFQKLIENRISIFAKEQIEQSHDTQKEHEIGLVIGVLLGVKDLLKIQPTIEAKPVVHAYWKGCEDPRNAFCINCGVVIEKEIAPIFRYCLACGAQMDEKEGEENG